MSPITLKANQAALIIETSPEGEITVEVAYPEASPDVDGFAAAVCEVLAYKLVEDDEFQEALITRLESQDDAEPAE